MWSKFLREMLKAFLDLFLTVIDKKLQSTRDINPFQANARFQSYLPFLCPLKTSKTKSFSDVFRGVQKRNIGSNGLKNRKMCENSSKLTNEIRMSSVYIARFEQLKSRFIISPIFLVFRILRYRQKMLKRKYYIWKFICQGNFALKK